jgi:hypothetical protein
VFMFNIINSGMNIGVHTEPPPHRQCYQCYHLHYTVYVSWNAACQGNFRWVGEIQVCRPTRNSTMSRAVVSWGLAKPFIHFWLCMF